jgi:hypothetical protein
MITIGKFHGYSKFMLRNGLLRLFTFAGIIAINLRPEGTNFKIIKYDNIQLIKNQIFLKLRI